MGALVWKVAEEDPHNSLGLKDHSCMAPASLSPLLARKGGRADSGGVTSE